MAAACGGALRTGTSESRAFLVVSSKVEFPEPQGININMLPFVMDEIESLPREYQHYWPLISACGVTNSPYDHFASFYLKKSNEIGFLTINEGLVPSGQTQRRGGLHVESPGFLSTPSSHSFEHHHIPSFGGGTDYHKNALSGGIFMASTLEKSCTIWNQTVADPGSIGPLGDIEHLRSELDSDESRSLNAGELVWFTDMTPHESRPSEGDQFRQFFRLVTSNLSTWHARHNTHNRLLVVPDPARTRISMADKFGTEGEDVEQDAPQCAVDRVLNAMCMDVELTGGKQVEDIFRFAPQEALLDREVMLKAVQLDSRCLKYAAAGLRGDRDIVLHAVRGDTVLQTKRDWRKNNRTPWCALSCASDELKNDRDLVLEAVRQKGYALFSANPRFRADREIVLAAVSEKRAEGAFAWQLMPLKIASDELRADLDVVRAALAVHGRNVEWVAESVMSTREGLLLALKGGDFRAGKHVPAALLDDREVVLAGMSWFSHEQRFKTLSADLRADREVVIEAVKRNQLAILHAEGGLHADREVALAALSGYSSSSASIAKVMEALAPELRTAISAAADRLGISVKEYAHGELQLTLVTLDACLAVEGEALSINARYISGDIAACVTLEPTEGEVDLRRKLSDALSVGVASLRILLPCGTLLIDTSSETPLRELLAFESPA